MRQSCFVLVAVIFAGAMAYGNSASAAEAIHVTIDGTKQGTFKSDSPGDREKIVVLKYSSEVDSPRDPATGQPSGKRQHRPIVITKSISACSPQLFSALVKNEVLKSVVIEFLRLDREARTEIYYTVRLTNATISSIKQYTGDGKYENMQLEEVTISFQKIEVENMAAKTSAADDWTAR